MSMNTPSSPVPIRAMTRAWEKFNDKKAAFEEVSG